MTGTGDRPFGYFVHHQGRGHAERCAAIAHALPPGRRMTVFCARADIFPPLPPNVEVVEIPSLFERTHPTPSALDAAETPETMHCVPLGWNGVREAVARITGWAADADPALFVVDVSAELCQLLRIASVPVVAVLQHGRRDDPGHAMAYRSSVGLLAPYAQGLEPPERPDWMRARTAWFGGLGVETGGEGRGDRAALRARLGLDPSRPLHLVIAGGGGTGTPSAPLTMAARANPEADWLTIGTVQSEWHETAVGNLAHRGWVENPADYIAAADLVVSSTGNTTVHMVAAAARPWLVIPEWRYFDEQRCKARALARHGAAAMRETWPACPADWQAALDEARAVDPARQRALVGASAARDAAGWLEDRAAALWHAEPAAALDVPPPANDVQPFVRAAE